MTTVGLRERKKAQTRRVIADVAARLFAERGYEQVAVSDVAREAEVSEQTVYNYFQTKWRGELGYLAAISPTVHRLALEMSDRQAGALATAIGETTGVAPEIARLQGIALAGVFQIIISEAGRRTREGQSQDQIADELRPAIERVLDDLDRWLGRSDRPTTQVAIDTRCRL